ncbi:D-alanyl-D-alanine carboxypeptidase, partial [Candidatus Nomurabacteria bacterium]|nr:D-alanyl-D-alanine carboxypeptidase [Candidatus Nomurabacteria bacterium]
MKSTRRKISFVLLISLVVMTLLTGFSIISRSPPEVSGSAYVLYDATTDTFLLGENQDEALSPASITKVMTVLLALENLEPDDTITITKEMYIDI